MKRCVLVLLLALGGCGPITFTLGSSPSGQKITSTIVEDAGVFVTNRVAIIDVTGLIYNTRRRGLLSQSENPVGLLHEKLEAARCDSRVKAVILRINSPGGTVTASDAMYRELIRFRNNSRKPVISLMMDTAASGGYYVSLATDRIVAYPTTVTGSIGVIIQTISLKPAMDRFGIHAEAITSGPNKDVGSPFSNMTDEHRKVLRAIVDDFYDRFAALVKAARPNIPADKFAHVTDGRVLSGTAAKQLGLVDKIGDLYDAFALAKKLANVSKANLVMYHRQDQFAGNAYAAAPGVPGIGTQINMAQINVDMSIDDTPLAFMYLWNPSIR